MGRDRKGKPFPVRIESELRKYFEFEVEELRKRGLNTTISDYVRNILMGEAYLQFTKMQKGHEDLIIDKIINSPYREQQVVDLIINHLEFLDRTVERYRHERDFYEARLQIAESRLREAMETKKVKSKRIRESLRKKMKDKAARKSIQKKKEK